jgi:membrane protein YqaA with SNARE-associated domain
MTGIVSAHFFSSLTPLDGADTLRRTMPDWLTQLLALLALPEYGLSTVAVVSFISATLLPMGSEPAVFGLVKLNPDLFWPAILVATAGNTAGGALDWWLGRGALALVEHRRHSAVHVKALDWLERLGPKACLLSWLPGIGDPLCTVAGWLKMPFWPCVGYMAVGKFLRYLVMTAGLLHLFPGGLSWMS